MKNFRSASRSVEVSDYKPQARDLFLPNQEQRYVNRNYLDESNNNNKFYHINNDVPTNFRQETKDQKRNEEQHNNIFSKPSSSSSASASAINSYGRNDFDSVNYINGNRKYSNNNFNTQQENSEFDNPLSSYNSKEQFIYPYRYSSAKAFTPYSSLRTNHSLKNTQIEDSLANSNYSNQQTKFQSTNELTLNEIRLQLLNNKDGNSLVDSLLDGDIDELLMSKTTNNWKSSFAAVRERFGAQTQKENGEITSYDDTAPYMLTNVASSSFAYASNDGGATLPRSTKQLQQLHASTNMPTLSGDELINKNSLLYLAIDKSVASSKLAIQHKQPLKRELGNFWIETVRNRAKSPTPHRITIGLSAAERLEQLHEPLEDEDVEASNINNHPQRRSHVDSVATRRNLYLQETIRSQSPNPQNLYAERSANTNRDLTKNYPPHNTPDKRKSTYDEKLASISDFSQDLMTRNGCGRFPTSDSNVTESQIGNAACIKSIAQYGISQKNDRIQQNEVRGRSPSPDTLSDISQNSLSFLPHPRPKHNIREQLLNAGIANTNGWTTNNNKSSPFGAVALKSRLGTSPNFPSPNYNSVAMRISALEKRPGTPKFLNLAGATSSIPSSNITQSLSSTTMPMSPKSTVFRTKPVIHMEKNITNDGNLSPRWRGDDANEATAFISNSERVIQKPEQQPQHMNAGNKTRVLYENEYEKFSRQLLDSVNIPTTSAPISSTIHNKPQSQSILLQRASQRADTSSTINTNIAAGLRNIRVSHVEAASNNVKQSLASTSAQNLGPSSAAVKPLTSHINGFISEKRGNISTFPPSFQMRNSAKTTIAGKLANIKRFHYPFGEPVSRDKNEEICERVRALFGKGDKLHGRLLEFSEFDKLCEIIRFPIYSKRAVYEACCRLNNLPVYSNNTSVGVRGSFSNDAPRAADRPISFQQFRVYWNKMVAIANDDASRFVFTLAAARLPQKLTTNADSNPIDLFITHADFMPMMMDIINSHTGLNFLKASPQFHSRYCEVVIVRIFWDVNRSWTGRITPQELRRSKFLETLRMLEEVVDINKVTDFFSYEHFYVTYCKFWELDTDHDMIISRNDMREHGGGALTNRIIDRIFSAAVIRTPAAERVRRGCVQQPIETIGFEDFVAFLLAEEDKRHPTSIEYWFRCIDLDGDGVISLYEMEYFYSEIEQKLLARNMETLSLTDVICNLLDSVAPKNPNFVTRADLKRCGLVHRFFNTFVNYIKYLDQESSEGERASVKASGDREMSDWETFCAIEYELLMVDTDVGDNTIDVILDDDEQENDNGDRNITQSDIRMGNGSLKA